MSVTRPTARPPCRVFNPPKPVQCAYSAWYGKPACGSPELLDGTMRAQFGWDGHVVSDCTAIELMQNEKWDDCKPPYPPLTCVCGGGGCQWGGGQW